jgi:5-methylcytosine-specific restriction enzyme A
VDAADHHPDDPNIDAEDGLVGVCAPCHRRVSAQTSQKRSVAKQNERKRKPEKHPGVLD